MRFFSALFIAGLAWGVSAQNALPTPAPKPKVLVAYEETKFKKALTDEIKIGLEKAGYSVTVITHNADWVSKVKASDYNAVFITNSGVNSMVRPWVVSWLEKNSAYEKRILVHTTKTRKWEEKVTVDAISSASEVGDVKKLAKEYIAAISAKVALSNSVDSTNAK